ncbi:MAG: POT family MFS transporter [Phycisphaerales bacterium]
MSKFLTLPDQKLTTMPGGVPFIVGNEAAERFSFYGMKTILVVFMTQYLMNASGQCAFMSEAEARENLAWFTASAYFFPVIGAIVADAILGKYLTIMLLSWVYCLGHLALALMDMPPAALEASFDPKTWMLIGLFLIAVGSGGIKPCVSAHVGDQFGAGNKHLLSKIFGWFYFSINFGSFFSTLLTPWLLKWHGPSWAFGVPGVLMFIATVVFWLGRHRFVHVQPRGFAFIRETFTGDGLRTILKLIPVYLFISVFWSLYDQTGGAWVLQAARMDREFLGVEWLESQVQAINPLLILAFIPLFSYAIYPAISKVFPLTPIRRISIGLFITVAAFGLSGLIESWIDQGLTPNIRWQLLAYVIITAAEVMVSITGLEFSYTQAPPQMKSFVMSLFLLTVSVGNVFTAIVNNVIQVPSRIDSVHAAVAAHTSRSGELDGGGLEASLRDLGATVVKDAESWKVTLSSGRADDGLAFAIAGDGSLGAIETAADPSIAEAQAKVEQAWRESGSDDASRTLPSAADGASLVAGLADPWGHPLAYRLVSPDRFAIESVGPDGAARSDDDIRSVTTLTLPDAGEAVEAPLDWRDRHVPCAKDGVVSGVAEATFTTRVSIGGGELLAGADYYWFFTTVMAIAAGLFVFVAMVYRPKEYIQGEGAGSDPDAFERRENLGQLDDR